MTEGKIPLGFKIILALLIITVAFIGFSLTQPINFLGIIVSGAIGLLLTTVIFIIAPLGLIFGIFLRKKFTYELSLFYYGYRILNAIVLFVLILFPNYRIYYAGSMGYPIEVFSFPFIWVLIVLFTLIFTVVDVIILVYFIKHKTYFNK